ncbi:MAG TPA: ATP-binding protein [Polyangia bacterium]|nr:ATP-binding protein [Polyangia bacterium]
MTLRAKILLAQTPLAGALVLIALLSAFTSAALGRNAASILQDNYRSVLAAERMKEALERIDSAAMFIVAGERKRGLAQAEQNIVRFELALETQQSNITERGEPEATAVLRRDWTDYRAAYVRFTAGTEQAALEADYFRTLNPLFVNTKDAADRILDLNQDAMVRKRDQARRASERSNAVMIATALLASLFGLVASTVLTRRILSPLSILGQTARRLGEGDMEVRAKVSRQDEIGTLARDFNLMADRLAQYRHSSLGELLQAQQQAQAAIDSLPDPVLIFDLEGRLLSGNRAAERILHVTVEEATGAPLARAEPQIRALVDRVRQKALADEAGYVPAGFDEAVRVSMSGSDGNDLFLLPRASRVTTEQGGLVGVTIILQDVTRVLRFDELKNNLVATVAHEFRTPLTSLRMAVHLCAEESVGPLNDKQLDLMQAARQDTERLQQIVDDLLDLSRIQSGRMELHRRRVSAESLVREAVLPFGSAARDKNVTLKTELFPGLGEIDVDTERMQLVLANLISNAIRYTPTGGSVVVRGRRGDSNGATIFIDVQDTGPGIPKQYQTAVFDKFFRMPGSGSGGAGLGLYIAKEIALAHGARLTLTSEAGQGSQFTVELPTAGE